MSIGWGLAFLGTGANIYFNLGGFGNDPRCMVGWNATPKYFFFLPTIGLAALAITIMAGKD